MEDVALILSFIWVNIDEKSDLILFIVKSNSSKLKFLRSSMENVLKSSSAGLNSWLSKDKENSFPLLAKIFLSNSQSWLSNDPTLFDLLIYSIPTTSIQLYFSWNLSRSWLKAFWWFFKAQCLKWYSILVELIKMERKWGSLCTSMTFWVK